MDVMKALGHVAIVTTKAIKRLLICKGIVMSALFFPFASGPLDFRPFVFFLSFVPHTSQKCSYSALTQFKHPMPPPC